MSENFSIDEINVNKFCDVQGISQVNRFALNIIYKTNLLKTYDEWFELLKINFNLKDKKDFSSNK